MTTLTDSNGNSNHTHTEDRGHEKPLTPFPAANNDYRYLRKRASILCGAFNALPLDVSEHDRAQAWNDIVGLSNTSDGGMIPNAPMIKGPINIDYGTNLHIHPSCFINRDCYIADSPDCTIAVGENTIIGVRVQILGVTHPIDWRERQGRYGPSLAGEVKIGNDCFIGAGVIVLPGVSIGDGCVIGAGAVVTKSVPAYHLAAGIPARVLRKVANNVPDEPSLIYETNDDRVVVCDPEQVSNQTANHVEPSKLANSFDQFRLLQWLDAIKTDAIKTNMPVSLGRPRHVAADVSALVVAAIIGYWLGGSRVA